jgi:DNA-binding transcriptional ArsR family regulator
MHTGRLGSVVFALGLAQRTMSKPPRGARSRRTQPEDHRGSPPADARELEARIGEVERELLVVLREQRRELGREPTPTELAAALGLGASEVRKRLVPLEKLGLTRAGGYHHNEVSE